MARDRKTLAHAIEKQQLSTENLEGASRVGDADRVKRIELGLVTVNRIVSDLQGKLEGGLEVRALLPRAKMSFLGKR